jgi:hypothetical protein
MVNKYGSFIFFSALVLLVDSAGRGLELVRDFARITENGNVMRITRFVAPAPQPPEAISAVLVTDISGSMSYVASESYAVFA